MLSVHITGPAKLHSNAVKASYYNQRNAVLICNCIIKALHCSVRYYVDHRGHYISISKLTM